MSTVKTDKLDQWHEYDIYTPARLIYLGGEIDEDSGERFIKNIRLMDHVDSKDITVLIDSGGGDVRTGLAIIDAIRECNSKVITHVVGCAWSMAAIIMQAGDQRKISSNATVMIHMGSQTYDTDHSLNIERWMKDSKRVGRDADNILLERIREKKPRFNKAQLDKLLVFDTIYTANQSLSMGLVDEIAEHKGY